MSPIGKFNASGIDDAMALVSMGNAVYFVGDGYKLVTIEEAALTIGGTVKADEFGNGATGIWS